MAIDPSIIFKMREMSGDNLAAAEGKFAKAKDLTVIDRRESGLFTVCVVLSEKSRYEVIRFFDFVYCPCRDFEFSGAGCKHAWAAMPKLCRKCRVKTVANIGDTCIACEAHSAPYIKRVPERKRELIGSIPI